MKTIIYRSKIKNIAFGKLRGSLFLLCAFLMQTTLYSATYYFDRSQDPSVAANIQNRLNWWTNSASATGSNPSNFTNSGDVWDLNLTSAKTVQIGGWSMNGTLVNTGTGGSIATLSTTGTFTSTYTAAVWIVPTATLVASGIDVTYSATATIPGLTYTNLTLSISPSGTNTANGPIAVSGALTINSGVTLAMNANTLTLGELSTLTLAATGTISTTAATPFSDSRSVKTYGSGTISYLRTVGPQTFPATASIAATFNKLTLGNSSGTTNTANGPIAVTGTLTINSGVTLVMGANTLILSGTLANSGTISTSATTAFTDSRSPKTFGGTVIYTAATGGQTIGTGSYTTLTLSNTSGTNTADGAITVSGTLTTTSGGTLDMGANVLTLSGTGTVLTNNGTISTTATTPFSDARTGTKTFYGSPITNGTIIFAATAGGQTIPTGTYNNLIVSNTSGTQTAAGAITVSGTLTTTAGGTLAMDGNTLTLGASSTLTNSGTISTTAATPFNDSRSPKTYGGTVNYNGAAQTVFTATYTNLTLSGSGVKTITNAACTVSSKMTISSGVSAEITNSSNIAVRSLFFSTTNKATGTHGYTGTSNNNTTYFTSSSTGYLTVAVTSPITSDAAGGTWGTNATWIGNVVPTANDDVVIANTTGSVTLGASATCANLSINNGSAFDIAGNTFTA